MRKILVLLTCAICFSFGFVACDKSARTPPPSADGTSTPTNPTAAPPSSHPEFQKLKGKWERPDGGYILEIRNVDADGKLDASYANPSPIKVSHALAYSEGGQTKVFVELTDVNYPGCTYKLVWDAQNDQLFGLYYQAAMQQTYDVAFARVK